MQLSHLIQSFYLLSAAITLALNSTYPLRTRFLSYGSRASPSKPTSPSKPATSSTQPVTSSKQNRAASVLDTLSNLRVPHAYFTHFYVLSVALSFFWALQYLLNGWILHFLITTPNLFCPAEGPSMTLPQIYLVWFLLLIQGSRRLYESIVFAKPSASKMWIGHYGVGMGFYCVTSVAIWVEGLPVLAASSPPSSAPSQSPSLTLSRSKSGFTFTPPLHTLLALTLFILASAIQHTSHAHLFSLKKYSLPIHPLFKLVTCPHYGAECGIYLALTVIAAPEGAWINGTILTALVFVGVNLGVTASGTRLWNMGKWGTEAEGRWCMVPFVY